MRYQQTQGRRQARANAVQEVRSATISYITDLESGIDQQQFEKHFSELNLLQTQDHSLLSPDQNIQMDLMLIAAGTLQTVSQRAIAAREPTAIKSDPRLLDLTRDQMKEVIQRHGRQAITCQAAADAVTNANRFLSTLAAP